MHKQSILSVEKMNFAKTLITVSMIIGILGWCVAAFLDLRQIGMAVFSIGFVVVAAAL